MIRLALLPLILTLSACATGMSKNECLTADWRAIGYEDGAAGRDVSAVSGRREACANKAKVTADMDAYLAGRDEGLDEFCRPANGFDFGARGGRYSGQCADRNEPGFAVAFEKGARLYALVLDRDAAHAALEDAEVRIARLDGEIAAREAAIVSPATPHLERVDHVVALKQAHEARDGARDIARARAYDLSRAEDAVEDYRAYLAADEARVDGAMRLGRT